MEALLSASFSLFSVLALGVVSLVVASKWVRS